MIFDISRKTLCIQLLAALYLRSIYESSAKKRGIMSCIRHLSFYIKAETRGGLKRLRKMICLEYSSWYKHLVGENVGILEWGMSRRK